MYNNFAQICLLSFCVEVCSSIHHHTAILRRMLQSIYCSSFMHCAKQAYVEEAGEITFDGLIALLELGSLRLTESCVTGFN